MPSDTYRRIYDEIIGDLISQILSNKKNYCVRDRHTPYEIGEKFEEYKTRARGNMSGDRLDRHKLSSCVCGAIVKAKPLIGNNIAPNANEILGLQAGLSVLKDYMTYDFLRKLNISNKELENARKYLRENFSIVFPDIDENICDIQIYQKNLTNSLVWSHHKCKYKQAECFHYDIWAYSTIFYHLEIYNKPRLKSLYDEYIKIYKEQGA